MLLDAMAPEAPFRLPARRPADALQRALRESDASAAALLDVAEDVTVPVPADVPYAEK